jgi:hypothetical protein
VVFSGIDFQALTLIPHGPNSRLKIGTLIGRVPKPLAAHHKMTVEELLANLEW